MMIDASTELYCLIGDPIEGSLSPYIHNLSFKEHHINGSYMAFSIKEGALKDAIEGIKALGIKGFNVTLPHKISIIKYLDGLSEEAELIGAVNTVKNINGRLIGYNTDGIGFIKGLTDQNIKIKDKRILILGAGGAAHGIGMILAKEGAKSLHIMNRTREKGEHLKDKILESFPEIPVDISTLDLNAVNTKEIDMVVNCTSVGMYPNIDEAPIELINFRRDTIICDIVYKPLKTKLLKQGELMNLKTINGLTMLINQAQLSEEIWLCRKIGFNVDEKIKKLKDLTK